MNLILASLRLAAGLASALAITLAMALICRMLPGGSGDRTGGVAAGPPQS